jgi:beta propeller repeat protein
MGQLGYGIRKKVLIFCIFIIAVSFLVLSASFVAFSTGTRLNSSGPSVNSGSSAASGNYVAWSDNRSGTNQIYVKNLASASAESQIYPTANSQIRPAIHNSVVVWCEAGNIHAYNMSTSTHTQLTNNPSSAKSEPAIYMDRVVWSQDIGDSQTQIYTKLLSEGGDGTAVYTDLSSNQNGPAIFGNYIVWTNSAVGVETNDVKLADISGGLPGTLHNICTGSMDQQDPAINETIIAWSDFRSGTSQIYYYDFLTGWPADPTTSGTQLYSSVTDQVNASVADKRIVWEGWDENPPTDSGIYMKDLRTGAQSTIAQDTNNQAFPFITGDRVTWETYRQDMTGWGWDINFRQTSTATIYTNDFETGSMADATSGWTRGDSNPLQGLAYWQEVNGNFGSPLRTHSGSKSMWCAGYGGDLVNHLYASDMNSFGDRYLDLTGYTNVTLTFWYFTPSIAANDQERDFGYVYLRDMNNNPPAGWQDVYLNVDENGYPLPVTTDWVLRTVDLSAGAGKIVKLRFGWYSDLEDIAEGTYIDDISITGSTTWPLDHLLVTPDTASVPINGTQDFTAVGHDAYHNTVSTPTISWSTDVPGGNVSPGTGSSTTLTAGTTTGSSYHVTATAGGKTGTADVTVLTAPLHHFNISTVSSPQTAGTSFPVTVTAKDQYDNTLTDFNGLVTLSDSTGTISPTSITGFVGGAKTQNVTITKAQTGVSVTASYGSPPKTGTSNTFTVDAAVLDHIGVTPSPASVQVDAQQAFTAQGYDQYNNLVSAGPFDWTTTVPGGSMDPLNGSSSTLTAGTTVGTGYTVTAAYGGKQGSASVSVTPGPLDHFNVGPISSPQTAGGTFPITITAKDIYNNTVTSFNNTVTLSDTTGTISPTSTSGFTNGVKTQNVSITQVATGDIITVSYGDPVKMGTSNAFDIDSGALDHFSLNQGLGTQTAGTSFNVTVTAKDQYNNTVTSFNNTVSMSDTTGTINPTTLSVFTNGSATGSFTITKAQSGVSVTATYGSPPKTGSTNAFTVNPAVLNHIHTTPSPVTLPAGGTQLFSAQGHDQYENIVSVPAFNWTTTVTGGNMNPASGTSSTLTAGSVVATGYNVTAEYSGVQGLATVNVTFGALHHFNISTVSSPQTAGTAFSITVTAKDQYDNTVTDFNNPVTLSDSTGTISPTSISGFVDGAKTQNVSLTKAQAGVSITASYGNPPKIGTSNTFTVDPAVLHHLTINNITSPKYAGTAFSITVTAKDQYENTVPSFTSTANLTDLTTTITPTSTTSFTNGVWTGNVTITQGYASDRITATSTSPSATGQSNMFDVNAAPPGTPSYGATYQVIGGFANPMPPGGTADFTVQLTNMGSLKWIMNGNGPNPVRLAFHWYNAQGQLIAWDCVRTDLPSDVNYGQTVTVSPHITVPNVPNSTYILKFDLVREGVTWFSQASPSVPMSANQYANIGSNYGATYNVSNGFPNPMQPGGQNQFTVQLTNTGLQEWNMQGNGPNPVNLAFHWYNGAGQLVGWDCVRQPLTKNVAPGETDTVLFNITTPNVPGSTYILKFDLVKEGVTWFSSQGVAMSANQTAYLSNYGATYSISGGFNNPMPAGGTGTFDVTLTNTGWFTWLRQGGGANPVNLAFHWYDINGNLVAWDCVRAPLNVNVAHGESDTIHTVVTAPNVPNGVYILRFDLVREGMSWFSSQGVSMSSDQIVNMTRYGATYNVTDGGFPNPMTPGGQHTFTVQLTNTGLDTWNFSGANNVRLAFHWYDGNGNLIAWDCARTNLTANVAPGANITINPIITTPNVHPSIYILKFDLVKEGVTWFSSKGVPMSAAQTANQP